MTSLTELLGDLGALVVQVVADLRGRVAREPEDEPDDDAETGS